MKISVLSTHHPSTVVLSWVAHSLWLEPWDQELNETMCPVQVSFIHCCAFVCEGCLFTLHTGHRRVKCVSLKTTALLTLQTVVPTILHFRTHLKIALLIGQETNTINANIPTHNTRRSRGLITLKPDLATSCERAERCYRWLALAATVRPGGCPGAEGHVLGVGRQWRRLLHGQPCGHPAWSGGGGKHLVCCVCSSEGFPRSRAHAVNVNSRRKVGDLPDEVNLRFPPVEC